MTDTNHYKHARSFFSSFFHQDWMDEGSDWKDVVNAALSYKWEPEELREIAAEIAEYIEVHTDDDELKHLLLVDLGSYYAPLDKSVREWLADVALVLKAEAVRLESQP